MKLLITTQSYSFFKRQWWQLSSLVSQVIGDKYPEITYRIHVYSNDRNIDLFYRMVSVFSSLINLDIVMWDTEDFAFRSNIRNKDIETCFDYDAILFVDPDIVFHFEVINRLIKYYYPCDALVACGRDFIYNADELIEKETYVDVIKDLDKKLDMTDISPISSKLGAGFFQYVTIDKLKERKIKNYCSRSVDANIFSGGFYGTRSEQKFRKRVGKKIFGQNLTRIYHLEHERYKPFDCK